MEIRSIARVFSLYMGKLQETIFKTQVDANHKEYVEQVVLYTKLPEVSPIKGKNVDVKV